MKWTNIILATTVMILSSGCVRMIMPTSVERLEQRAYEGQRDTLVEVDYVEAYRNMKRYYDKCVNDRVGQYQPLMVSSKLEREQGRAEFIGELPYHTYMFRINLTEEGEGKTRIHFIRALPTQMGWLFLNNPPSKVRQKSALEAEFKFLEKLSRLKPEEWEICSDVVY